MEIENLYEKVVENKDKVFFDKKGLTSSEANHKADLLKAKAAGVEAELKLTASHRAIMNFDGKSVALDNYKVVDLATLIPQEGQLYALSAWLREGVKAKKEVLTYIKNTRNTKFLLDDEGFTPFDEERPTFQQPAPVVLYTENDVIGEMSIKERAEYLAVEAKAAHIGKKIHNNGKLVTMRKTLQDGKISTFKELPSGNGDKAYLVEYERLYEYADIDKLFFEMQAEHRSLEQKLNWYKANIENAISKRNATQQKDHAEEVRVKHGEFVKLTNEFNVRYDVHRRETDALSNKLEIRRLELVNYVSSLKIVIPEQFNGLIETL